MFNIKKEAVEIIDEAGNKEIYEIGPLPGAYLGDMYSVVNAFHKAEGDEKDILKVLGEGGAEKLHTITFATLKQSYPDEKDSTLSQFVSQNLMKFVGPIMKINLPKDNN